MPGWGGLGREAGSSLFLGLCRRGLATSCFQRSRSLCSFRFGVCLGGGESRVRSPRGLARRTVVAAAGPASGARRWAPARIKPASPALFIQLVCGPQAQRVSLPGVAALRVVTPSSPSAPVTSSGLYPLQ